MQPSVGLLLSLQVAVRAVLVSTLLLCNIVLLILAIRLLPSWQGTRGQERYMQDPSPRDQRRDHFREDRC